jgi:uncharacterized damage-inducible protein DinB
MSLAEHARLLFEYNRYANAIVLDHALDLDDAALDATGDASRGSIRACLQHIVSAQAVWLSRWNGRPLRALDVTTRESLRAAFEASDDALREFASELDDASWARLVDYTDTKGNPHTVPLGVLITHVVNHGTLHRGEAGVMLAAHGRSPGDLDFVFFVLQRQNDRP